MKNKTTDTDRTGLFAFIIIVILMFATAGIERAILNRHQTIQLSDTVYVHDTIVKPLAVCDTLLRWDTVHLTKEYNHTDLKLIHDTLTDSVYLAVPIFQKTYEDSTYHAVISGYRTSLDTMIIHQRTITKTVTNTITKTQRLGLGISAGYDPINNRPSVMIGINYNILGIK